jgi:uncharacterized protein YbaR (Trm112 family)/SAM-dependent methyltransferase
MRSEALRWIACPECHGELTVQPFSTSGDDVQEGLLWCGCGAAYPIDGSIPRLLPEAFGDRPDFTRKHQRALRERLPRNLQRFDETLASTVATTKRNYGDWWKKMQRHVSYGLDNDAILEARTGLAPGQFGGKVVFDAGCGSGRFLPVYARNGAKAVVAMDLSDACEMAAEHSKAYPNVHVIQGNMLMPPTKWNVFDHTLTFGVLMITPDPRGAFNALSRTVRVGGQFSIYVYERQHKKYTQKLPPSLAFDLFQPFRKAVSYLPHPALAAFCRGLWAKRQVAESIRARGFSRLASVIARLPPDGYKPMENGEFNIIRNYDLYACRYLYLHSVQEILEWYRDDGYNDVIVTPYRVAATGTRVEGSNDPLRVTYFRARSVEELESRGIRAEVPPHEEPFPWQGEQAATGGPN